MPARRHQLAGATIFRHCGDRTLDFPHFSKISGAIAQLQDPQLELLQGSVSSRTFFQVSDFSAIARFRTFPTSSRLRQKVPRPQPRRPPIEGLLEYGPFLALHTLHPLEQTARKCRRVRRLIAEPTDRLRVLQRDVIGGALKIRQVVTRASDSRHERPETPRAKSPFTNPCWPRGRRRRRTVFDGRTTRTSRWTHQTTAPSGSPAIT